MQAANITEHYLHLTAAGEFVDSFHSSHFWQALASGQYPQLQQGMLCSAFEFASAWSQWERHPAGAELVVLLQGKARLILEQQGGQTSHLLLKNGDFVLVPSGVWHTADPLTEQNGTCTLMFFTPGADTEHKPRLPNSEQD